MAARPDFSVLLRGRESLADYYVAQAPKYELARHIKVIIEHLEALERGDFNNLMIFIPPRYGKELGDSTPILTANRGWITHGTIEVGDYVFHPSGKAIRVGAVIEQPEPASLEVEMFDGAIFKVHPNHEWRVFDRRTGPPSYRGRYGGWRTVETRYLLGQTLVSGNKKPRATFQLPQREALRYGKRPLPLSPYVLGVWLGDGTSSPANCGTITHAAEDSEVAMAVGQDFVPGAVFIHPTTGVKRSGFYGLQTILRKLKVAGNKHIPREYLESSIEQRLELLAGLIDTDGYVNRKERRVCFVNANRHLVDNVVELIRGLGWRVGVVTQEPVLSTSGIQGVQPVHYVRFSPDLDIPTRLPRKKINFRCQKRRIGIKAVRPAEHPEPGRCIQVDSPDGLYLVGRELIPTHNSELATAAFPAWYLGRHPENHVMMAAYAGELIEDFSQKARNYMQSDYHRAIFPECRIDERWNAKHDYRTTVGGALRAVGRGGAATGRGADLYLVDDCIKDRKEAESPAIQKELRDWFTDVVLTRRHPNARLCIINTRWSPSDLCGWELDKKTRMKWTILELPALGRWMPPNYTDREGRIVLRVADEQDGDALWPERFPREYLEEMRDELSRDSWLALYQQRPTFAGDEQIFDPDWFQVIDLNKDRINTREMYGHILVDPASKKKKGSDYTVMWVVGMGADRNYYYVDGICDKLGLSERWDALLKLHKKWNSNFKSLRVWWEQLGKDSEIEYFHERMKMGGYRFAIDAIGSTAVRKEDMIRDFGTGICKDLRVYFNGYIPIKTDGKRTNLANDMLEQEWSRYPAVKHDDRLNAAAYIIDPKIGVNFPRDSARSSIEQMYEARRKRYKGISPLGA